MRRFKEGKIQLLVATTVIEVGVDVPNATLMVIENAERMGLAQLHQLRGRVGRGQHASSCLLLYRSPLSPLARERLAVMRDTNDGFEVARRDLELRGPGELLGTRQTGLAQMRVADLLRDADLLPRVQIAAETHAARLAAARRAADPPLGGTCGAIRPRRVECRMTSALHDDSHATRVGKGAARFRAVAAGGASGAIGRRCAAAPLADRQGIADAADEGGLRRALRACVWWINGADCSAPHANRHCVRRQCRLVPGRGNVQCRRAGVGVRADRDAGFHAGRSPLACRAGRFARSGRPWATCRESSAAPTNMPGCRRMSR